MQLIALGTLLKHLAPRMQPGNARPVAGVEPDVMGSRAGVEQAGDRLAQRVHAFPGQRRDANHIFAPGRFTKQFAAFLGAPLVLGTGIPAVLGGMSVLIAAASADVSAKL